VSSGASLVKSANKVEYRLRLATLTQLGAEFYFSCHAKDFKDKYSNRVRFKRASAKRATPRK
jgi:hypothetical protein